MSRRYPHKDPPFGAEHFLVVDLEATCDRADWPRERMEIIEIGAVLIAADAATRVGEFQTFVRPRRHPTLTDFCRDLTGIAQAEVDRAPEHTVALEAMFGWLDGLGPAPGGTIFCSWGGFDARLFAAENARHGVTRGLPPHWNLARAFSGRLGLRRRFSVLGALERVELAFEGRPHRGIDDARNIARLLPWCLGREEFPAEPPRWVRRARRRAREAEKAARGFVRQTAIDQTGGSIRG